MSKKSIAIKMPTRTAPTTPDEWVSNRTSPATAPEVVATNVTPLVQPAEPMKRFTIDVSEGLHRRIKAACAGRGEKMADVLRDILEREFPAGGKA